MQNMKDVEKNVVLIQIFGNRHRIDKKIDYKSL
jgi:hypothetical protein